MMSITEARARVGQQLGYQNFGGSIADYQALTSQQQIDLDNGVAAFIVANPSYFTPDQVRLSSNRVANPQQSIQDTSINWTDFGNAVVDNAGSMASSFTAGLSKTFYIAMFVVILAGTSSLWLPALRGAVTKNNYR